MTTDKLLMKLPSHIGRNKFNGFYLSDNKKGGDIGWLYLHFLHKKCEMLSMRILRS